jgi:hypothetical protein
MFFNVLNPGPTSSGNYQQPNTQAPAPNASIGKPLPPPANTATAETNYVQPDFRKPAANAQIASTPTLHGNPMDISFPIPKNNSDANAELLGATGRAPSPGIIPPVLHVPYSTVPGN